MASKSGQECFVKAKTLTFIEPYRISQQGTAQAHSAKTTHSKPIQKTHRLRNWKEQKYCASFGCKIFCEILSNYDS